MGKNIEVEPAEAVDLREAVDAMIHRLLDELAHADQREYRSMLRAKLARFERLAERLDQSATAPVEVIRFA
jgi:hypothetical protein